MKAKRRTVTIDLNYKREYFEKLKSEGWRMVSYHHSDDRLPPGFACEVLKVVCYGWFKFYKRTPVYTIFDNGGESLDRYSIINEDGDILGLSGNPTHPLGFSQFCGNCVDSVMFYVYGGSWRRHFNVPRIIHRELPRIIEEFEAEGHLGERVEFVDLPEGIQEHIKFRFETIN